MPKITAHGGPSYADDVPAPTDPDIAPAPEPVAPEDDVDDAAVVEDDYDSLSYDEIRHEVGILRAEGAETPALTSSREVLVEWLRSRP